MAKINGLSGKKNGHVATKETAHRQRVVQADLPACSPSEAFRIAQAVSDHGGSAAPLDVAAACNLSPSSGQFRMLTAAAVAYGYTDATCYADSIALQPLASRILSCTEEGDDAVAKREAFLRPKIIREFLTKYDSKALPKDQQIMQNVLGTMGVPREGREKALKMILDEATALDLIQHIKGGRYVNLKGVRRPTNGASEVDGNGAPIEMPPPDLTLGFPQTPAQIHAVKEVSRQRVDNRKVFITHGKNREFITPLKDLLSFGNWEAVVSTERESVSQPVPDKVMKDMRQCCAAVIHVDAELKLLDPDGNQHIMLNPNVMMEIGAAMALYGNRFILLVRKGVTLPSNLQGLYEVRYDGDKLDGEATIRLLKAIKDINNHPLPKFDEPVVTPPSETPLGK